MKQNDLVTLDGTEYRVVHIHQSYGTTHYVIIEKTDNGTDEGREVIGFDEWGRLEKQGRLKRCENSHE